MPELRGVRFPCGDGLVDDYRAGYHALLELEPAKDLLGQPALDQDLLLKENSEVRFGDPLLSPAAPCLLLARLCALKALYRPFLELLLIPWETVDGLLPVVSTIYLVSLSWPKRTMKIFRSSMVTCFHRPMDLSLCSIIFAKAIVAGSVGLFMSRMLQSK